MSRVQPPQHSEGRSARTARVLAAVDAHADAMVTLAQELVRIPTINPPGERYQDCAELLAERMRHLGFAVELLEAEGRPEHTAEWPRINVLGSLGGNGGPCVHLNGHFDVVPAGDGWTVDPFGGLIREGRLYGRGSADMKAGLAAALYAAAAVRDAFPDHPGRMEVSGTVDEESGGFAGVAHLAELGRIGGQRPTYVIIPEPFGVDRICVGHRGVYWFRITALGHIAHGSMPFLGRSAIDDLAALLAAVQRDLIPAIQARSTTMPVVPEGARHGSLNVNSIQGGQIDPESGSDIPRQSPCVADRAEAVFDRRFLPEERIEDVRAEVQGVLDRLCAEDPERRYELTDLLVVEPTRTPDDSPVIRALEAAVSSVVGRAARRVASPGTYDQKHVARIAGVEHCVAYGPGALEQAHQPDESCAVADMVTSAKVMALATLELLDPAGGDAQQS